MESANHKCIGFCEIDKAMKVTLIESLATSTKTRSC
nr:hypothetical protein [Streptococcus sp. 596553]